MFLLIPQKWRIYEQSNANFKFHYVSINSGLDLLYLQVLIYLNYIMFLLILIDKQGAGDRKMALNSIMFLLITDSRYKVSS